MINSELISHSLIANERIFIMDLILIHLGKFKARVDAKPGPADEDDGEEGGDGQAWSWCGCRGGRSRRR